MWIADAATPRKRRRRLAQRAQTNATAVKHPQGLCPAAVRHRYYSIDFPVNIEILHIINTSMILKR